LLNDAYDKVEKQKKREEREQRKQNAERERDRREDAAQRKQNAERERERREDAAHCSAAAASSAIINDKEPDATEDATRLKLIQLISSYMQQLDPCIPLERVTLRDLKQAVMPHFDNWVPLSFSFSLWLLFVFSLLP
jgi:hypothetical protein